MRKVIFYIDDLEYLRRDFRAQSDLTENQLDDLLSGLIDFKAIYTLYGNGGIERYELTDMDGRKIDINSLNHYQRGIILGDCKLYFDGGKFAFGGDMPTGVIRIEDSGINGK